MASLALSTEGDQNYRSYPHIRAGGGGGSVEEKGGKDLLGKCTVLAVSGSK